MRKLLDNPYIVGALVILALLVAFRKPVVDWMQRLKSTPVVSTIGTNINEVIDTVKSQTPQKAQSEIFPDAKIEFQNIQWILKPSRNPFKKITKGGVEIVKTNEVATVTVTKQPLKLTAILVEQEKKFVMINGTILSEGETISGYKITSINRDYVLLEGYGEKRKLTFNEMQQESGQKQ